MPPASRACAVRYPLSTEAALEDVNSFPLGLRARVAWCDALHIPGAL